MSVATSSGPSVRPDTGTMATERQRSSSRLSNARSRPVSRAGEDDQKTAVKVAVRVRPPLSTSDPGYDLIPSRFRASTCQVTNPTTLTVEASQGKKLFVFDRVFADTEQQEEVWEYIHDSVNAFVQGYNVSILAYGQSGAGKSYTMGTSSPGEQNTEDSMGIVPRAATSLFDKLSGSVNGAKPIENTGIRLPTRYSTSGPPASPTFAKSDEKNWQMKATYVEIYNEQLRDLLVPDSIPQNERNSVTIREDTKGRIILTGLQQITINTIDDLLNALNFGSSIRQTDATAINSKSSRSHAVFSLNLVQKKNKSNGDKPDTPASEGAVTTDSKLHFVDLAGSERLKNSGLTGERVKEGISINAGLASLGKVISQLSSRTAGSHVSYRDSKLTRLLQDSLGGNAITYMVACINPVEFHLSETLNTVQYAQRARAIQSRPQIQQRSEEGDKQLIIDRLRSEVAFLRDQVRNSQHSDRKVNSAHVRTGRKQDREIELQSQLLDIQENYSALSQRHAKLVAELARGKSDDVENLPTLKGALGSASLDRLNRSSNFAEAVEQVVVEYEKTIQNLESSLSNSRSSLSTSEGSLLEKEGKVVYLEAVTQQLQSRIQKLMDREANSETYLRELESKLDGISTGEEKHIVIIQDLRKELGRVRESEASAEDYISTLEERLAEAEQDTDLMQREIGRLENIVERQRSIGKLDNLLSELDNIRNSQLIETNGTKKEIPKDTQGDAFHDRLVATTSVIHPDEEVRPETAEEEWKGFGPMDGDDDTVSQSTRTDQDIVEQDEIPPLKTRENKLKGNERRHSQAQARAVADKLETMTMELFDLKVDHEAALAELDDISRKYQIALGTLAELQDAVDGARGPRESPFSERVIGQSLRDDGRQSSSSRMLQSELSSHGESPTLIDNSDIATTNSDHQDSKHLSRTLPKEETLAESVRRLKRANAEKDINITELNENYTQLQDQHKDTLNYIEELKEELQKAQTVAPAPATSVSRRSMISHSRASKDRETRVFLSLRNIATEHLEKHPEAKKTFESNVNAVVAESRLREERVQALEAEIAAARKEMDVKNTMISGLTRERSLRAATPMDVALVASTRDQLQASQKKIAELQQSGASENENLLNSMVSLKNSLDEAPKPETQDSTVFEDAPSSPPRPSSGGFGLGESRRSVDVTDKLSNLNVVDMKKQIEEWEAKHHSSMQSRKKLEDSLMEIMAGLDGSLQKAEQLHTAREVSPELRDATTNGVGDQQAKHEEQISALQKEIESYKTAADTHAEKLTHLEKSYAQIIKEVEEDSKSRQLTESELQTHRDLVMNLEEQIDQQKSLATFHQQGLKSLQESHANELDGMKKSLASQQAEADLQLTEQLSKHQATTSSLQEELTKAHMEMAGLMESIALALNEENEGDDLHARIKALADDRQSLQTKHVEASEALVAAQQEMQSAKQITVDLETKIQELTALNEETLKQLERSVEKEQRSSRIVQELEDQLSNNFDQQQDTTNRLSTAQKERADVERELEDYRAKVASLENQLVEMKRMTTSTYQSQRDSQQVDGEPRSSSNLRKSNSVHSLPSSPPPNVPLPPLPGNNVGGVGVPSSPRPDTANTVSSRPDSRNAPTDLTTFQAQAQAQQAQQAQQQQQQQIDEQDNRIRTLEKHLYAEKQLTQTLEEALVDLETQANKTKSEMDAWRKKYRDVEEEATGLRRERGTMRHSLQAVEEERDRRIRAEEATRQLEERMEALGRKPRKKGTLNCF